jgi:23S rRNA (uracil1939-C5)-methyltransferase
LRLSIDKLIYGGDGLARLPSDEQGRGKAVFVPFTVPGDVVEATLTEQKPGFARATIDNVITAATARINPDCEYFTRCGGCHYQHISYESQIALKAEILRENFLRLAKVDLPREIAVHGSPPWEYRNRSRFQIRSKGEVTIGYYRLATHDVLDIERCPISSPLINRALSDLRLFCKENPIPTGITEAEFFANAEDDRLLIELTCTADTDQKAAQACTEKLHAAIAGTMGVVAFPRRGLDGSSYDGASKPLFSVGNDRFAYQAGKNSYRISAGAFFQINRYQIDELLKIVTHNRTGDTAIDLYAGVGLFTVPLARSFRHIRAVESSPISHGDLLHNAPENVKTVRSTTERFLEQAVRKAPPELIIVDPPRNGLGRKVSQQLAQWRSPRITYVSCDPSTLARDLLPMIAAGYRIEEAHLVDLFPQTYHIETVLHLVQ